jgi:ketosteroid isomerase-like protein
MTSSSSLTPVRQSPAQIIGAVYAAFGDGDIPAVLTLFADDIAWHISGRSPLAGDYTGHDDVLGFFGQLVDRSNGTFDLEIHDHFDNGRDTAVVLVTERARRDDDRRLEAQMVHIWRVEDAKATSFQAYVYDEYTVDEFWS